MHLPSAPAIRPHHSAAVTKQHLSPSPHNTRGHSPRHRFSKVARYGLRNHGNLPTWAKRLAAARRLQHGADGEAACGHCAHSDGAEPARPPRSPGPQTNPLGAEPPPPSTAAPTSSASPQPRGPTPGGPTARRLRGGPEDNSCPLLRCPHSRRREQPPARLGTARPLSRTALPARLPAALPLPGRRRRRQTRMRGAGRAGGCSAGGGAGKGGDWGE